jgi:hypothetical protein
MIPIERDKLRLELGNLENRLATFRGQLADLEQHRDIYNADIYARDKKIFEGNIRVTEEGIAKLKAQLGEAKS